MKSTATTSLAALGIGIAALLAGCTSSGSPASSQAPAASSAGSGGTVASATPAGGGAGSTSGGSGGASGTAPAGSGPSSNVPNGAVPSGGSGGLAILACPTSGLKLAEGTTGAAAGSVYMQIEFTNTSGRTCTLFGYPGVALTTSTTPGSQVGAAARRSTGKPKQVITLTPGQTASATLQIAQVANYPSSSCQPVSARYLQVYPPGQTSARYLPYTGQGCMKPVFVLGIEPVQVGTGA
jgi:Protein of unknown function (DUF4232)